MIISSEPGLVAIGGDGEDADGYSTYWRTYQVESNNRLDGPVVLNDFMASFGFVDYSLYNFGPEININAVLMTWKPEAVSKVGNGHFLWHWTGYWCDKPIKRGEGTVAHEPKKKASQSPPERPNQLDRGEVTIVRNLLTDFSDTPKPVRNKAGIPLPLEFEIPIATIQITFLSGTTTGTEEEDYVSTCNDWPFFGYTTGQLLCKSYHVKTQYEQGIWFYEKQVTFWIANKWLNDKRFGGDGTISWDKFLANSGLTQLKDGKFKKCVDAYGCEASEPMFLLANGAQKPAGSAPSPDDWLRFRGNPKVDWINLLS